MEFKVVEKDDGAEVDLDRAMVQMREKSYGGKYRNRGDPIHHVALAFGQSERNILGIRARTAPRQKKPRTKAGFLS